MAAYSPNPGGTSSKTGSLGGAAQGQMCSERGEFLLRMPVVPIRVVEHGWSWWKGPALLVFATRTRSHVHRCVIWLPTNNQKVVEILLESFWRLEYFQGPGKTWIRVQVEHWALVSTHNLKHWQKQYYDNLYIYQVFMPSSYMIYITYNLS